MRPAQRKRLTAMITGLLLFLGAASLCAQTGTAYYYVSPTGDDLNPGTESFPWRTLAKAASMATANVTVFIKQGTYRERLVPVNSGTAEGPITLTSYPGDSVIITGVGMTPPTGWWAGLIWIQDLKYIRISGLTIRQAPNVGIDVESCSYVTVEKNHIDSTYSPGIKVYGSDHVVVEANEVVHGCLGLDNECISIAKVDIFEIKNNLVHDGMTEGIDMKYGSSNGIVSGNQVFNESVRGGIYIDAWTDHQFNIDIFNNVCHHNASYGFAISTEKGGLIEKIKMHHNKAYANANWGFLVVGWCGEPNQKYPIHNIEVNQNVSCENQIGIQIGGYDGTNIDTLRVYDNICYHNMQGLGISGFEGPSEEHVVGNADIVNNTLYGNGASSSGWLEGGIFVTNISSGSILIRNNILSANAAYTISVMPQVAPSIVNADYNFFDGFRNYPNETAGTNAVYGNPLFVDTLTNDYHLQAASPCIDKGHPNQEYNDPADPNKPGYALYPAQGTIRNDMGAYGGPYASSWDTTVVAAPSAPTLPSPSNGATGVPTTLVLSWNGPWAATSYRLQVSTSSGFSPLITDQSGITGTSYGIRGFANNTRYYWRVSARNAGGTGSYSNTWSFTTMVQVPPAPTLASPSDGATGISTSPALRWNASVGATSYALQLSTSADFSTFVVNQSAIASTWLGVGLLNNTTYYWRVNATNAQGTSAWSSVWSFTTILVAPSAPTLASPANGTTGVSTTPTLRWNASTGAGSYRLQISKNETFSAVVFDSSGIPDTSYVSVRLLSRTTHYWRVNARNVAGTSGWSTVWNFTTMAVSSVEEISGTTPTAYALRQNFPNPFNPTTKIQFDIPQACIVTLKVFTLLGKEVATLVSEELMAGSYRVEWDVRGVASGVYLCRMSAGSLGQTGNLSGGSGQAYVETKKLVLIK